MGFKNHQKYTLTAHAVERYKERFNPNESEATIHRKVKGWLQESDFLQNEPQNRQTRINQRNDVVMVIEPSKFKVITLYAASTLKMEDMEIQEATIAERIVSDLVKGKIYSIETDYFAQLSTLYKEYGERLDKLSRTTKHEVYAKKRQEASAMKHKIEKLEVEFTDVMDSLRDYIK